MRSLGRAIGQHLLRLYFCLVSWTSAYVGEAFEVGLSGMRVRNGDWGWWNVVPGFPHRSSQVKTGFVCLFHPYELVAVSQQILHWSNTPRDFGFVYVWSGEMREEARLSRMADYGVGR